MLWQGCRGCRKGFSEWPSTLVIGLCRQALETSAILAQWVFASGEPVFYLQQKALSHASWYLQLQCGIRCAP
jgi:hypothetical protein